MKESRFYVDLKKLCSDAIKKFKPNLNNTVVYTEAATGNYCITPVIAALCGAKVFAVAKNSKYGSATDAIRQTKDFAKIMHVSKAIKIVTNKSLIPFKNLDIITNTGFVRPIDKKIIKKLDSKCVIPLMWEPWEFRSSDIDIDELKKRGIKVYGTNENHKNLKTFEYLGFVMLKQIILKKITPESGPVLIIGSREFAVPVKKTLASLNYKTKIQSNLNSKIKINKFKSIIILEHKNDMLIIGKGRKAYIQHKDLKKDKIIFHLCGNIDVNKINCDIVPKKPAKFGYMSFTSDDINPRAVVDLHTAGLKVAEGMIKANKLNLKGHDYKKFMEKNYPAKSFIQKKYW